MVLQKTLTLFFFWCRKNVKKLLVPAETVRKVHGKEVVSFHRVASLTAYKYLRRIIVLYLVSHCIKVYNIYNIHRFHNIHKVWNIPSLLLVLSSWRKMIIATTG